jgi:cytochrome oxidase assembly protein ShyY1
MRFKPGWKLTLFCALLLPLLLALGMWQLGRAEQKAAILERIEARRQRPPADFSQIARHAEPDFMRVALHGEYLTGRDVLLDNRTHRGRFGYEWVQPFRDQSGVLVLVSRGWIAGSPDRTVLPALEPTAGTLRLLAEVYVPLGKPFSLAASPLPEGWPKRVQNIDFEALDEAYQERLYPHVLRLLPGQPTALTPYWQDVNMQPAKHRAYAVQWFAMAATLAAMYLAAGLGFIGAGGRKG